MTDMQQVPGSPPASPEASSPTQLVHRPYRKYTEYHLEVVPEENDKAAEIKLLSCARPHMRSFHFAWFGFFIAFTAWFSLAPLMPAVIKSVQSAQDIQYTCTDKVCSHPSGPGTMYSECKLTTTVNNTLSVTAGGFGPLAKKVPTGMYPAGKDKRNDQTGELCSDIKKRTKSGIWTANIVSVSSTILFRFLVGPLCDKIGPRLIMSILLVSTSIPAFAAMGITSFAGLAVVRALIGIAGATFVPNQYWTSMLFAKKVVGVANGTSAGWGNLGGGFTQIFMVGIFSMIKASGQSDNMSWRLAMIVPGLLMLISGTAMWKLADDCPQGNYLKLQRINAEAKKRGQKEGMENVDAMKSAYAGFTDVNAWILNFQYAACFGVELHVNNSLAFYLYEGNNETSGPNVLDMSTAGMIASLFGLMNLFARSCGGILSDFLQNKFGSLRGRLWAHFLCLFFEGWALIAFSRMNNLPGAIVLLITFSCCVQASEGATYAVVPYVNPPATGTISGIVGAGGNMGAMSWGMMFLFTDDSMSNLYMYLGFIIVGLSCLTSVIFIPGHPGLFCSPHIDPDAPLPVPTSEPKDVESKGTEGTATDKDVNLVVLAEEPGVTVHADDTRGCSADARAC